MYYKNSSLNSTQTTIIFLCMCVLAVISALIPTLF